MTRFLSKAAICSIWFMLIVIIGAKFFTDEIQTKAETYANISSAGNIFQDENDYIDKQEEIETDNIFDIAEAEIDNTTGTTEAETAKAVENIIPDVTSENEWEHFINDETALPEDVRENCIIIKKPEALADISGYQLTDEPVDRTLTLSVPNLDSYMLLQQGDVCRVRKNIYYELHDFKQSCVNEGAGEGNIYTLILKMDRPYVYSSYEDAGYIYIKCENAYELYDKLVVIDAGHGGKDSGTVIAGEDHYEKRINLEVLLEVKKILDRQKDIKVYYTRTTDKKVSLTDRVKLANALKADFFLSIHCNSAENKYVSGFEVLYNELQEEEKGMSSKQFAKLCLEEGLRISPRFNRGLIPRSSDVLIIREANMPVALLELGYLSNKDDLEFVDDAGNKQLIAEGIYNAICRAFDEREGE